MKKLSKVFALLILLLPLVLIFSYYPVISFGADSRMNFELSLPLIWLVVFDAIAGIMMIKRKVLFRKIRYGWLWLLFPVWLAITTIWSLNWARGILTVGILWLIYFAGFSIWRLREIFDAEFKVRFWKWFFGAMLIACGWCILQCVLDLAGVTRDYSLMCAGCTYRMFGFPHPNGFAIEPQFMGNLLLAPAIMSIYYYIVHGRDGNLRGRGVLPVVFCAVLFLTFSRGAIYAFVVGMGFLVAFLIVRERKKRKDIIKRIGMVCGVVVVAFIFSLNLQGVMSAVSPTNDTYGDGVAKVLNHLSLGAIDLKKDDDEAKKEEETEIMDNESVFDGYVEESTNIRMELTNAALETWSGNYRTMIFGVGLGGAGQAMYEKGLTQSPKEIVQNQYASLLLESGVVGIVLLIITIIMIVRIIVKAKWCGALLALMVSYGVSLCFFAGLPNALHIYLLFVPLYIMSHEDYKVLRK